MKILHVAECIGGVDRYLKVFLKYSKFENVVVLSKLYNIDDYVNLADKTIVMDMKHSIGIYSFIEAIHLRKIIKQEKPDIVFAHSSIAGAIMRIACIGIKTKKIYNPHGWSFNIETKKRRLYLMFERILSIFCDYIICISLAEKESALKNKVCNEKKLKVICNGIDFDEYEYKENKIKPLIPDDYFVVGMVGRICKQKAPDIFVKMASEVQKKLKKVFFIIVGDVIECNEQERIKIENMAKEYNVNLFITGWVKNPFEYIKHFDVACVLSRWEGFGLVIPEYMLAGVPIVATNIDAIPYIIDDNKTGILIKKDDWQAAANAVVSLANDEIKRKKIISNGKEAVKENFDAKKNIGIYNNFFEEIFK